VVPVMQSAEGSVQAKPMYMLKHLYFTRNPTVTSVNGRAFKSGSLQLRVLRFGFFQNEDIGVGVFPER
jgi:hypothetical protein